MEYSLIILRKTALMLIYMGIGFFFYKKNLFTKGNTKALTNLLVKAVLPCVVIHSFMIDYSNEGVRILADGLLGAIVILVFGGVLCYFIFGKDVLSRVGVTFPNAGFCGIPLVVATFGSEYLFYMMPLQISITIIQYTYASLAFKKEKTNLVKELMTNPLIISAIVGLSIYFFNLNSIIPTLVKEVVDGLFNIQTPLAMIIVGTYLAQIDFKHLHIKEDMLAAFVRLILIPVCVALIFKLLPISQMTKDILLICTSCSIGSNIAVYAQMYDGDYIYACEVVSFSMIISAITIPLIIMLFV